MNRRFRLEHVPGERFPWRVVSGDGRILYHTLISRRLADVMRCRLERNARWLPATPTTPDELAAYEGRRS